jgi:signal transduction histidine kinase
MYIEESAMDDRIKDLEAQLRAKDEQLQETLENLERIRKRDAENREVIGDLIAGMVHSINNLSTRIRSSSTTLSHAFSDLRQHLPTLLFEIPPEHQRDFLALVDRAYQNQRQCSQRLSSREERHLRRVLTKELEAHALDDVDEIADLLVDMGVYEDIDPFIPLLRGEHHESVLQAAYSLMNLQDQWNLKPASNHIMRIIYTLQYSIMALLTSHMTKDQVTQGIEKVVALYQNLLENRQIDVLKQYEDVPAIPCYPELDLVWMNLIENAIEAIENQGTLEIIVASRQLAVASCQSAVTSRQLPAASDQYIVVQITDSGCGIPEEIREKIFERSVTTKSRTTVHGPGLYIVRKIIDKHQGKIDVESQPGRTTFRVWLPYVICDV